MTISLSTVHVIVDDPDAALSLYRDTLGLTVTNEVPYEGFKWITLVTDSQPEVAIVLSQPHAGRSREAMATPSPPCSPRVNRHDQLPDRRPRRHLREGVCPAGSRSAPGAGQPVLGARDFAVRDFAGNTVRIEQA